MTTGEYFNKIAEQYEKTFDIYRDKEINGEKYLAYGHFYSHSEKYVLVKEVQLWEVKSHEHIIFMDISEIKMNDLKSGYLDKRVYGTLSCEEGRKISREKSYV